MLYGYHRSRELRKPPPPSDERLLVGLEFETSTENVDLLSSVIHAGNKDRKVGFFCEADSSTGMDGFEIITEAAPIEEFLRSGGVVDDLVSTVKAERDNRKEFNHLGLHVNISTQGMGANQALACVALVNSVPQLTRRIAGRTDGWNARALVSTLDGTRSLVSAATRVSGPRNSYACSRYEDSRTRVEYRLFRSAVDSTLTKLQITFCGAVTKCAIENSYNIISAVKRYRQADLENVCTILLYSFIKDNASNPEIKELLDFFEQNKCVSEIYRGSRVAPTEQITFQEVPKTTATSSRSNIKYITYEGERTSILSSDYDVTDIEALFV